ncbi:hypothetical protein FF100_31580 [Methylobacterium terricola]|uniref:DUF6894 domain-containing protein n=1 Tax=Methylobacterium terricola TaxID=2583531 RepID=A0A5C4L7S4_9HYPH|nr:hypothetical protein [Methylobacterium terricola]TNC07626.1 hypothetical protein FF100_31580 [Methylobacterium terricola]
MARYFFHLRHEPGSEGLAEDFEGDELPDATAAREHALMVARDLITRTRLDSVRNWFDCSFEITDEQGHSVMTVPFTDTVPEQPDDGEE